ncbi:MAG: hypothetical protein AB1758_29610 [Candidatus Eremiobacterota bacterium]
MTACKSNLKNIGTALETFYSDVYDGEGAGRYPSGLGELTPNYLKALPICPSAGTVTYDYRAAGDRYTFVCRGTHHKGVGITAADYPQYTSVQGLIERP